MGRFKKIYAGVTVLFLLLSGTHHASAARSNATWVYRCNRDAEKTIALTFDDGPHPTLTPEILSILKKFDIPATFFVLGENAERYPSLVNRIRDEGHEIGNHTYSHMLFGDTELTVFEEDMLRCEAVLGGIMDTKPKLFRPPGGLIAPELERVCDAMGYRVILWSVDTKDWTHVPSERIAEAVLNTVRDGDIILMHDYIGSDSPTPEALKQMIPALLARGYRFALVSDLLSMSKGACGNAEKQ